MTPTIPIFLSYLNKISMFKHGSLKAFGLMTAAPSTYGFYKYIDIVFEGADMKEILLAITIEVGMIGLFAIFSTIDMVTGIQAALHENAISPEPKPVNLVIRSNKLWATFWKFFGIVVLTIMLTFLSIIAIVLEAELFTWLVVWALIGFWIMACSFEFYSIGENLGRKNGGKKPRIFEFFDKVLEALQQKAIDKINDKL